jgi:hypothetical protein
LKQDELDAAKQLLEEEFGLVGLSDPEEIRSHLLAKFEAANVIDRAALYMRLGGKLRESKQRIPKKAFYKVLARIFLILIAWFAWRPLAVVVTLFVMGNIRYFAIEHSIFWRPSTAAILGSIYGLFLSIIVWTGAILSKTGVIGDLVLATIGLMAAGYVAYGVPDQSYRMTFGDEKRSIAAGSATILYSVTTTALFFGPNLVKWIAGSGRH